ncbi:1200_t:CDS:2, partial [Acaulospora colombiana]
RRVRAKPGMGTESGPTMSRVNGQFSECTAVESGMWSSRNDRFFAHTVTMSINPSYLQQCCINGNEHQDQDRLTDSGHHCTVVGVKLKDKGPLAGPIADTLLCHLVGICATASLDYIRQRLS